MCFHGNDKGEYTGGSAGWRRGLWEGRGGQGAQQSDIGNLFHWRGQEEDGSKNGNKCR